MAGHKLVAQRNEAALLLAAGKNQAQTAEAVGVTEVSVHRWLRDPEFRDAVKRHTEQLGAIMLPKYTRNVMAAMDQQYKVIEQAEHNISPERLATINQVVATFWSRAAVILD